ncbi:MAG: hypothetical protein ACI4TA_14620 [Acetatifactor sp.]
MEDRIKTEDRIEVEDYNSCMEQAVSMQVFLWNACFLCLFIFCAIDFALGARLMLSIRS